MAADIIPETIAPTHFVELVDTEGRLVLLPRAMVHAIQSAGQKSIVLTISLTTKPPLTQPEEPITPRTTTTESSRPWLTVTEAAKLHLNDVDGITLEVAKACISRACRENKIVSIGEGTRRRVDPISLDAWRLAERERDLAREDK